MTWRTWRHCLLLFTTLGNRAGHSYCYTWQTWGSLSLLFTMVRERQVYKPSKTITKLSHNYLVYVLERTELIDFIAYSNEINDFGRIQKHLKTVLVTHSTMVLLIY